MRDSVPTTTRTHRNETGLIHDDKGPNQALKAAPSMRKGRTMLFGFILLSVATAATAQLMLKHGMTQVTHHGAIPLDLKQPVETVRRIAVNASVWIGLAIFVLSAAIWLVVLSRVSLSFAYPFVSLPYVI